MFKTVLIANRGAIACRIERSLRQMGVRSIAVYAESDYASRHVADADLAVSLGAGPAASTYLDARRILEIARAHGAEAIHPGYGFLSENAAFAEACEAAGIAFIGPASQQMRAFGLKHAARALAEAHGVPLLQGSGLLDSLEQAQQVAGRIGFPLMLKSTAGGGGIGMRVCRNADDLAAQFEAVRRLGQNNFADAGVFLEQYIERARHIEVQIFGDGAGGVIALGERDCSVQRRNQKVIEETPAPDLPETQRAALRDAALRLARAVSYRNAGTVEFVYDSGTQRFYFLEVNTRLQVEHGVTEQVWGVDLVRWMIEQAAGVLPPLNRLEAALRPQGHAVQARVYAEDPGKDFQPSPGLLSEVQFPPADGRALRIETWVDAGVEVPPSFDPMIAKLIAWAPDRSAAIAGLDQALAATCLYGTETNRSYLRQILSYAPFVAGQPWTRCLDGLPYTAATVEVLDAGTQTTVQDWPGRQGYWDVGIPPSGPMDDRALRLGNALLGNPPGAAALEITLAGPTLRFRVATQVVISGAALPISLNGQEQPANTVLSVPADGTLRLGRIGGAGCRAYLCVRGGFAVPEYLGSRSTFTLGRFGGHAGRQLAAADVLHLGSQTSTTLAAPGNRLADALCAPLPELRQLRVLYGPHAAPEYFTPEYIEQFFAAEWSVHFNSSRTGVRLVGPKPQWTRSDGGEAGLHPSNIHDNAYAVGAVDFTGDMPVILGPDGPSLGGFVCPVTVIEADLWQLGQLKAGDRLRFIEVDAQTALAASAARAAEVAQLRQIEPALLSVGREGTAGTGPRQSPVLLDRGQGGARLLVRRSGDTHVLAEFGDAVLDLALRFRIDALQTALGELGLSGLRDLTPGIRSLQLHFDPQRLPLDRLLDILDTLWARYAGADDLQLPSRIVHLPLSWDDPATRLAIEKYTTTVRPNAPWCPSNIEFIRRINGLDSIDEVKRIVFDASYLVMGLGDVYLGAPVATPLDPRHRLVTTKYNPARTWTPENAVGIGGAYLCVYGMEGPGGYQFVGRTLQMWNRDRITPDFHGKPYLLRFFDQIRFFEVSSEELLEMRRAFPLGRYRLRIEDSSLSLADYRRFLSEQAASIAQFKARQQSAFEEERAHWERSGLAHFEEPEAQQSEPARALLEHETGVFSPVAGNLWQMQVGSGDTVAAGQVLAVLEAMKMEIQIASPAAGRVSRILVQPGGALRAGQAVLTLEVAE